MHLWLRLGIARLNKFVGFCARLAQTFRKRKGWAVAGRAFHLNKRNVGDDLCADRFVEFLDKIAALHHQRGAGGGRRHADGEHLVADADGFRVSAERYARNRRPRHEGAVFVERGFEAGKAQKAQKHAAYFFRLSSFHTFCSALM